MHSRIRSLVALGIFALPVCGALAQPQGRIAEPVATIEARRLMQERFETQRRDIVSRLPFRADDFPRLCLAPPQTNESEIDVHRSLFVHDRPTLEARDFSLTRTLGHIAAQVEPTVPLTSASGIFRQLWDTQNPAPGIVPASPHCTDAGGTVNGFTNQCRQAGEGQEAVGSAVQVLERMKEYRVVALVNRLDLAHEGWRNCGEHRIIYGKPEEGINRNLIIFEAVLPNPKPGCRDGCLPVAKFWKDLSDDEDHQSRAAKLEKFFYEGLPGFRPVVHVDHYSAKGASTGYGSAGSGQIRTNQFRQQPWVLKEFKTLVDCGSTPCKFNLVPIMVKVNPFGELWNEDKAHTAGPLQSRAAAFQADVLLNIDKLANAKLTGIGYSVALDHDAAQSFSQTSATSVDNYREQFNAATGPVNTFRNNLATAAATHGLTADQIVNRALTQSCAGCHKPSGGLNTFNLTSAHSIGPVLLPNGTSDNKWPDALSFVHVETRITPRPELDGVDGHELSPALNNVFLPDRKQFLLTQLNASQCACRTRFPFLTRAHAERARRAQEGIDARFADRIRNMVEELQSSRVASASMSDRTAAQQRIAEVQQERETALQAELKRQGIALPTTGLSVQPLKLNASRQAAGNVTRERELRQLEVLRIVKEEPPRRTVTGSFAPH